MSSPNIMVAGLTKAYGSSMALDGAEFKLEGAGVVAYLGPNGAGKTTTLKILTALIRPSRGRASVNGIDIIEKPREAPAEMGAAVETPEPPRTFTVRDSLQLVGSIRGMSRESIEDRISHFDRALQLPALNKRISTLSTGLRQSCNRGSAPSRSPGHPPR